MNPKNTAASDSPGALTRRRFVQGAAVAAAAPLLLGRPAFAARADDPEVLRVGLVGCGGRGTGAAFNALSAEPGSVRLVAMADVFPDRLASSETNLKQSLQDRAHLVELDDDHRFVGFDAAERLIASDVDVVLLATPPHFRPEHLALCVAADKHVFCEKPMAVDAPGVRSVLETAALARQKRLALVSGFCWRSNVRHRELMARLADGAVGEIQAVYTTYNASPLGTHPRQDGWTDMEWQLRNWQHFLWLGGDHIVEQAVHSLDKMAWVMGDVPPASCTAVGGRQARQGPETGNIYDHFGVTYDYADGSRGFHMSRQIAGASGDNSDHVYGTAGRASIATGGQEHVIEGARPWRYEGEGNDMYQAELDEMFASIRAGEPRNDGVWMSHSTMLAIMGRMAAYTGQTITWEQALASTERLGPTTYAFGELEVGPVPVPGRTKFV